MNFSKKLRRERRKPSRKDVESGRKLRTKKIMTMMQKKQV